MWGKVSKPIAYTSKDRITPTHVGKRLQCLFHLLKLRDHPHPCGEKQPNAAKMRVMQGSPPPMWGKVSAAQPHTWQKGITPPMWGKASSHAWIVRRGRITPTHVGKRSTILPGKSADRDHPHPCGEKAACIGCRRRVLGSPPPMWGKARSANVYPCAIRITPTHVGKSKVYRAGSGALEDHPHPCGEKCLIQHLTAGALGSPPPMWGKDKNVLTNSEKFRITPTHVGKRSRWQLKKKG